MHRLRVLPAVAWAAASLTAVVVTTACALEPSPATESTPTPTTAPSGEQASESDSGRTPPPTSTPPAEAERRPTASAVAAAASNASQTTKPASQDERPSPSAATSTPQGTPAPASRGERSSGSSDTANTLPPAATSTGVSATSTEQAVDDGSPLGDCFGGVLSGEPVHCYVLERAQAQGLIDVVAIYEGAGLLHVSIRGELSRALGAVRAREVGNVHQRVPLHFVRRSIGPLLLPGRVGMRVGHRTGSGIGIFLAAMRCMLAGPPSRRGFCPFRLGIGVRSSRRVARRAYGGYPAGRRGGSCGLRSHRARLVRPVPRAHSTCRTST